MINECKMYIISTNSYRIIWKSYKVIAELEQCRNHNGMEYGPHFKSEITFQAC